MGVARRDEAGWLLIPHVDAAALIRADDYLEDLVREFALLRLEADAHDEDAGQWTGPAGAAPVGEQRGSAVVRWEVLSEVDAVLALAAGPREQARTQAEAACAAGLARCDLELEVSARLRDVLPRAQQMLEGAAALARSGDLLTLPPSHDVEAFWRAALDRLRVAASEPGPARPPRPRRRNGAQRRRRAMTGGGAVGRVRFPCSPTTPGTARRWLCDRLAECGEPDLAETATLPLTELVTNAVLHARTPVTLVVFVAAGSLRVEVHDGVQRPPAVLQRELDGLTGRGLELVAATTTRWGVTPHRGGKAVWFEVLAEGGTHPGTAQGTKTALSS